MSYRECTRGEAVEAMRNGETVEASVRLTKPLEWGRVIIDDERIVRWEKSVFVLEDWVDRQWRIVEPESQGSGLVQRYLACWDESGRVVLLGNLKRICTREVRAYVYADPDAPDDPERQFCARTPIVFWDTQYREIAWGLPAPLDILEGDIIFLRPVAVIMEGEQDV